MVTLSTVICLLVRKTKESAFNFDELQSNVTEVL